jgi:hypothetical protein
MLERFDGICERYLTEMLGMEWERDIEAGSSTLHQRVFTEKLLKAFSFWQYSKLTKTPQAPGTRAIKVCAMPRAKAYGRGRILLEISCGNRADLCIHYGRTKDGKIEDRELNRLWSWVDADLPLILTRAARTRATL